MLKAAKVSKRNAAVLWLISLVVGTSGVLGFVYVSGQGWNHFSWAETMLYSAVATVLAALLISSSADGLAKLAHMQAASGREEHHPRLKAVVVALSPQWNRRSVVRYAVLMAVLWLPWFIANYPGGTYWDTYYQIFQCYPENHPIAIIPYAECYQNTLTDAWLCDHHPIFDTLIYGAFGMASDALTGNWMLGVCAFVTLQGAAHVVVFSASVAFLRSRTCPPILCALAYIFFCTAPFISTWALCMVKDSLFGLFFVPYMMMLFELVRTRGAFLVKRHKRIVAFVVLALLLCLTKKTGLYVVVATSLVGLVTVWVQGRAARRKINRGACEKTIVQGGSAQGVNAQGARKGVVVQGANTYEENICEASEQELSAQGTAALAKALGAQLISCALVLVVVFPLVVFPLLNIEPGGKQEVLGTLFQQTARVVTYYEFDVTEEERTIIDRVLEYDNLPDQYTFNFQDEVKYRYKLEATADDLKAYVCVWFNQGLRHPEAYLASLMSIAGYYVSPAGYINIRMVTVDTHMGYDDRYMLWNPDVLDGLRTGLDDAYKAIATLPGVDLPLLMVVYLFWIPAILLYMSYKYRLKAGLLLVPVFILLVFCVIAPVNDARYGIPLFNVAPLLIAMMVTLLRTVISSSPSLTTTAALPLSSSATSGLYASTTPPVTLPTSLLTSSRGTKAISIPKGYM